MIDTASPASLLYLAVDAFSTFALLTILAWTMYHTPVLLAGLLARNKHYKPPLEPLNTPKLSVIIPVKDEGPRLKRCLEAILSADYPEDKLEVIVVDASTDHNVETLVQEVSARNPGIVKLIREDQPRGKPHALNLALASATGDVIAVFDADNVPAPDSLRRAVARFKDSRVIAVQGLTEPLNGKDSMVSRVTSKEEKIWYQVLLLGRWKLKLFTPLTGSCQFIRADVLKELGGWDEDRLAEDLELSLKLFKKGYRVEYAPDVISLQEVPTTLKSLALQRHRWYRGYMEALTRYFKDLLRRGAAGLDALILSGGPYLMVFSFLAIVLWLLSTLIPHTNSFTTPAAIVAMLNFLSLFTVSLALTVGDRPVSLKNLGWIPFIYIYWLILTGVATVALLEMITRRPRVWRRTPKEGKTPSKPIEASAVTPQ